MEWRKMTLFVSQMHKMVKKKKSYSWIFLIASFRLYGVHLDCVQQAADVINMTSRHLQGLVFIEKCFNNRITHMFYFS